MLERMRGTGRAHAARPDCTNPHLAARTEAPASHPQTLRLPQPLMHHSLRRPVPYPHHCLASAACTRHAPSAARILRPLQGQKKACQAHWLIKFQPAEMLNSPSLSEIPNSAEETAKPSWKRSHRIQQGDQKSVCQIPRRSRRKQTLMKSGRCWFQEAPWRNQKYRLRSFKKGATEF